MPLGADFSKAGEVTLSFSLVCTKLLSSLQFSGWGLSLTRITNVRKKGLFSERNLFASPSGRPLLALGLCGCRVLHKRDAPEKRGAEFSLQNGSSGLDIASGSHLYSIMIAGQPCPLVVYAWFPWIPTIWVKDIGLLWHDEFGLDMKIGADQSRRLLETSNATFAVDRRTWPHCLPLLVSDSRRTRNKLASASIHGW